MANNLRETRLRMGLTLAEVADLAKTTATQISRLETGTRRLSPEWKDRLAAAMKIEVSALDGEKPGTYISKLFPEIKPPRREVMEQSDLGLIMLSAEVLQKIWEKYDVKKSISPRVVLICSIRAHDAFFDLYKTVGASQELMEAVRQFIIVTLASLTGKEDPGKATTDLLEGRVHHRVLDRHFDTFRELLEDQAKPMPEEADEEAN